MKTQMKKIGIVGFTPATTIVYYREIVKKFQETFDPQMFPEMTLDILNLHKVHHSATDGHFDIFIEYICNSLENLKKAGADFGVISSNTPHMFFNEIQARVDLPLVNLVTATFDVIAKTKLKNIGLIGTRPTMELDFYKTPFQNIGINVHVRCTEFPLFVKEETIGIPAFDTIDIHVDAIINYMKKADCFLKTQSAFNHDEFHCLSMFDPIFRFLSLAVLKISPFQSKSIRFGQGFLDIFHV
jgi:aspartate racemase